MAYLTNDQEAAREKEMLEYCKKISDLLADVDELQKQLKATRDVLMEVQERNRKLDWLLTQAVEGRQ